MNRNQGALLFIENEMAVVADAEMAVQSMWARVRSLCYRPAVTLDHIDAFTADLHTVEMGLAAARRVLQRERADV